ncbi:MAG: helix-turn-helix transcriptional regulator [Burkholderiales bacterium]|nr:helix-turn-helix transcriptional regulator [Burkholderiales bacterium]
MQHHIRTTLQLGQLLLSARKQQGLSQAELAARLGLSQARISQLEQQPQTITAQQLLQLTSVLGLELLVQTHDSAQDAGSTEAEW